MIRSRSLLNDTGALRRELVYELGKGEYRMNENFSKNLRKLRLEKKLTQEQVAEKLGVSAQSVSRWETGATFPDVMMLPELLTRSVNQAKVVPINIEKHRSSAIALLNNAAFLFIFIYSP